MKGKLIALAASGALALTAAACSQEAAAPAKDEMDAMESSGPAAVAGPIRSTGTVTAIDAAAGTISLDHAPIAAINWPAMSMQFRAEDPTMLQGIAVGDQVTFELKSESESSTIIMVQKQ